jgi:hypothetical protein
MKTKSPRASRQSRHQVPDWLARKVIGSLQARLDAFGVRISKLEHRKWVDSQIAAGGAS